MKGKETYDRFMKWLSRLPPEDREAMISVVTHNKGSASFFSVPPEEFLKRGVHEVASEFTNEDYGEFLSFFEGEAPTSGWRGGARERAFAAGRSRG